VTTLLAKSPRGARQLTLQQHLLDTEQAAHALFRKGSRWARSFLRFFKLPDAAHDRFLLNLRIAALFHDIGKANDGFLNAVTSTRFVAQSLRHEHLSAIVLAHPEVRQWLAGCASVDVDVVLAAVLSHHLKAAPNGEWQVLNPKSAVATKLFLADPQVVSTFERIAAVVGLAPPQLRLPDRYDHPGWQDAWDWFWDRRVPRFTRELAAPGARERLALHLAVKAGVIAADSVASAMVREGKSIVEWIDAVAHAPGLAHDSVARDIIEPRIAEISRTRAFAPHRFQDCAAEIGRRGLLVAACGAGKTLAAWRWADAVARTEPIGRVIFLYPTRGTATEGFRDYVAHAPEGEAALVHGTSEYELRGMQSNPPTSLAGKDFIPDDAEARLFALGLWTKRYFSATVDQFLSFIEHGYGGLCLLPALADAAVVFDEVHSYDRQMWNALISFLRNFDVPVLCMTATLPPTRRAELAELLRVFPDEAERTDLADLEESECHPRYRIESVAGEAEAFEQVVAEVRAGRRVLWVVNTVKRCQALARRLSKQLDGVLAYHSRFKLEDRQHRHRDTVDAFRAPTETEPKPAIAVTTQVCEMSLDLDADVLVTEHAPISSLVQRFGRTNRHLRRGRDFRARLVTYCAESALPYETDELAAAGQFLRAYSGRDVSQRDLADGLAAHSPPGRQASGHARFLDGGYFATPGSLRDTDDAGAPVILDRDLARFRELDRRGDPTDGLRLTVPKKFAREVDEPGLPSWLQVADGSRYDAALGFLVADEGEGR
jgi:CRISPR-associated endonuclease/helicase Cas3